ncbi:MAG: carbohydrate-binding protein [Muribaculaceae bacterium]|nr:carbohydrate-binding protein [Muribaculaceae bacterium]
MNLQKFFIASAAALIFSAAPAFAKAPKRGISENEIRFKAELALLAKNTTWFYNWGNSFGNSYLGENPGMEFVPMCWSGSYDENRIRAYAQSHPETKYLLGFNEPNFTNQANMTPQAAAAAWPRVQALAKELGLKLVAPAMNYSPNPPYQSPTQWFDEFVALVGSDAFDYLAVHSYGGFGNIKELATTFHDRYGKDVWVTEFCLWPDEGNPNSYVSPEAQIASMIQTVEWLEKTPWIFRYAWFKAIGNSNADKGPNFGLIAPGSREDERLLSEQGKVYYNMPTFDPDVYHSVNTFVPTQDFIAQNGILLGSNTDPQVDAEIEITRFNAGAWADYQFDVPADGDYVLTLRVAGQGEPVRFDPIIGVFSVNADSEQGDALAPARQFTLSGSNDVYTEEYFTLSLKQGKQTIRIADTAPYSPSGIRISGLRLTDAASIRAITVDDLNAATAVYNLQGQRVSVSAGLPGGVYIVGNQKIFIK